MKIILVILFAISSFSLAAQSKEPIPSSKVGSVSLVASGLTCSMCSKAIYKSLLKVPFVSNVEPDIEKSSYEIFFRKDQLISLEELKKAVEDAGFAVDNMKINPSGSQKKPL